MDKRKRLYKAGPRDNPTLSERLKETKNRRQTARLDKFAASRKIPLDNSFGTPMKTNALAKVSQIVDRNQKLNAYRLQKNTQKFKEFQEQRSPFIVAVPVGRWIQKKERFPQNIIGINQTPVRNALMNERVLKKSTVKSLIAQSTIKKENLMVFGRSAVKPTALKSKKKILGELNSIPHVAAHILDDIPDLKPMEDELNSTFDISPVSIESDSEEPVKRSRQSNSMPDIVQEVKLTSAEKVKAPVKSEVKKTTSKATVKVIKPIVRAVIKKPVVIRRAQVKEVPVQVRAPTVRNKTAPVKTKPLITQAKISAPTKSTAMKVETKLSPLLIERNEDIKIIDDQNEKLKSFKPIVKKKEPTRSQYYKLYKCTLDVQVSYLTLQISELMSNKEAFLSLLTEDQQTFIHQTAQQGNLLISDKLKKFEEFLEEFESGLSKNPNDLKRVTEDDVENYWYLIYEEIEKLKDDLKKSKEIKKNAQAVMASLKKGRARRTYIPESGTPKRSLRIAGNADTPKHNASCYGCVTMSASKMNTPKSAQKRRTTIKKSAIFETPVPETPKRGGSSRRSSKRQTTTVRRGLRRMDAIEGDADENGMDLRNLL